MLATENPSSDSGVDAQGESMQQHRQLEEASAALNAAFELLGNLNSAEDSTAQQTAEFAVHAAQSRVRDALLPPLEILMTRN